MTGILQESKPFSNIKKEKSLALNHEALPPVLNDSLLLLLLLLFQNPRPPSKARLLLPKRARLQLRCASCVESRPLTGCLKNATTFPFANTALTHFGSEPETMDVCCSAQCVVCNKKILVEKSTCNLFMCVLCVLRKCPSSDNFHSPSLTSNFFFAVFDRQVLLLLFNEKRENARVSQRALVEIGYRRFFPDCTFSLSPFRHFTFPLLLSQCPTFARSQDV